MRADANCAKSNPDFRGDELIADELARGGALVRAGLGLVVEPARAGVEVDVDGVVDRGVPRDDAELEAGVGRAVEDDEGDGAASLMNSKKLIASGRHYEWKPKAQSVLYGTKRNTELWFATSAGHTDGVCSVSRSQTLLPRDAELV